MRLALYLFIFLGSIILVLDLAKQVKEIEPPEKAEADPTTHTPVETHGSQDQLENAQGGNGSQNPHGAGHGDIKQAHQALAKYTQAIESAPDQPKAYIDRSNVYIAFKKYDLALADTDQAIKLDPKNTAYLLQRGYIYLGTDQSGMAVADFTKALEIEPSLAKARVFRAITHYQKQNHQAALDDCLIILKNDPSFTDLHITIARCYQALGQNDNAIKHTQLYLESSTDEQSKQEGEALMNELKAKS